MKGANNIKVGGVYQQTFLTENDTFGIVNPAFCPDSAARIRRTPSALRWRPYDLTNTDDGPDWGAIPFRGHTDVKEVALYAQDTITEGPLVLQSRTSRDFYNGLRPYQTGGASRRDRL